MDVAVVILLWCSLKPQCIAIYTVTKLEVAITKIMFVMVNVLAIL